MVRIQIDSSIVIFDAGTNINGALEKGITFIKDSEDNSSDRVPLVLFLTDGRPNVGVTNADNIAINVLEYNNIKTPIFALAFGDDADFKSLRQIASQNNGVARKIYASSDAALQLEDFYNEISTTLLSKLTFKYLDDEVDEDTLTPFEFPNYFHGTEVIIAGKLKDENAKNITIFLCGISKQGIYQRVEVLTCILPPYPVIRPFPRPPMPTADPKGDVSEFEKIAEKLWAYLTIKKMIRDELTETNDTIRADVKADAVALAVKVGRLNSDIM